VPMMEGKGPPSRVSSQVIGEDRFVDHDLVGPPVSVLNRRIEANDVAAASGGRCDPSAEAKCRHIAGN
jgi:hypothetical protein